MMGIGRGWGQAGRGARARVSPIAGACGRTFPTAWWRCPWLGRTSGPRQMAGLDGMSLFWPRQHGVFCTREGDGRHEGSAGQLP
jgi:hypothetical protein